MLTTETTSPARNPHYDNVASEKYSPLTPESEATLALAHEQRTTNLLHYLEGLPAEGHHEGPAVLTLIRERLGLATPGEES